MLGFGDHCTVLAKTPWHVEEMSGHHCWQHKPAVEKTCTQSNHSRNFSPLGVEICCLTQQNTSNRTGAMPKMMTKRGFQALAAADINTVQT